MKKLINAIEYLQQNDQNGLHYEILEEVENGTLTLVDAKIECITILQRLYNECVESDNFQMGSKIASLAMELQRSL